MTALGTNVYRMLMDPSDTGVLYVFFYGSYGLFRIDLDEGYFISIANVDPAADDQAGATTLPTYTSSTFTSLGETLSKVPTIYDLHLSVDAATGKTKGRIAVFPFCDSGWGLFPTSPCSVTSGGGIYERLFDLDLAVDATIPWTKLNAQAEGMQSFMAYRIAFSKIDPNIGCVAGANMFGWPCSGNPEDLTAGVMCTKDGGSNWFNPVNTPINAVGIAASADDANVFAVGLSGGGIWILDLSGVP
jgi:hypothetical protein